MKIADCNNDNKRILIGRPQFEKSAQQKWKTLTHE